MEKINIKEMLNISFGNKFLFHDDFFEEFTQLVSNSGQEERIIGKLIDKLNAIIRLEDKDYGIKWLEHLKAYGNMYSLHIDLNKINYRLLFSKTNDKKYFLHIFYEKSGKKETAYDKHVEIAVKRRDGK